MAAGSLIQIYPFNFKPSAPPVGSFLVYSKTDNNLYLQDSSGIEYAFASTAAITQLTGEGTAVGPGSVPLTLSNSAVIGKVLTGFSPGPNSVVLATDTILQAIQKLQAQVTAETSTAITALTGDVSATGPGSVAATVNSVGGSSAANIHSAELAANAATASNTASTIVKRDASGNFAANVITASLSGNATTSTSFTGSLVGDVTGTQGATVVSTVGGSSAANVHSAELAANAATSANTPNTIVKRDGSGNFTAGTITANLTGNASTSTNFTGSLSGDVTGTQSTTAISNTTVTGKLLTGFVSAPGTVSAADSILTAIDKLDGNINSTTGSAITALTGDVVATGPGSAASTIQANVVSNSKLAQMPANTLKGNNTGVTANAADLTVSQVTAMVAGTPVTQTPDQANAPGSAGTLARADHIHNIPSGVPVQIGTSNIQGSAATFSLADHVHNHGNQTVGTLHAAATTSVNGFMSAADKVKINAFSAVPGTNTQILISDGTNLNPETVSGDISNTNTGVFTVNTVGGSSAANIHSAELAANAATASNTASTIVKRDASGNFSAGTITASLSGNATNVTGVVAIANGGTNNSSAYTAGSIIFSDGTKLTQDNANFFWNDTNQSIGIGVTPASATFVDAVNTSGAAKRLVLTGYGAGSTVGFRNRFARGTSGTPAAAQSGDTLGFISGQGYGTSQFPAASTGAATFVAGETFTNTSNLTYFTVSTTPTGSVTVGEAFRVASTGVTLGPQSSSTAIHQVNGGIYRTTRTITANLTIDTTTTDDIIFCNQSGAISITLPAPVNGRTFIIKDISGTANTNNITLTRHASEKIEGLAANRLLETNWGSWTVTTNGTDWFVL